MRRSFLFVSFLLLMSCATRTTQPVRAAKGLSWTVEDLIAAAHQRAIQAEAAREREAMKSIANEGIDLAQQCLERAPEMAGCYYYRALNTGLYYQARIIGYQTGIKQMVDDLNRVIQLDRNYDHAGADRVLGQIYTKLPQTTARADGVVRDLAKAEQYLNEAVRLAPDYPENHLALAEALIAADKFPAAVDALAHAKELAPEWQRDTSYAAWQLTVRALEHQLAKKIN